ncbi:hypothetical protein R1sor_015251 [Riccia sorocarpa]|uniref:Reverse transcriptase domain-containing protein n=1 Tax=Riccia sorocarpa TaxID=122646 RepID=A0ABD3HEF6_9MARC
MVAVETFEDSIGVSPVQRGTEQRRWDSLVVAKSRSTGARSRARWEIKWRAAKQFLKKKQWEAKAKQEEENTKLKLLQSKLRHVARDRVHLPDDELEGLEREVKQLEKVRAERWRRWSKIRWFKEGDAPSKFFFAHLKAKRAKEEITTTVTDDGQRINNEEEIIQELHGYYSQLYAQPAVDNDTVALRERTLSRIKCNISREQNGKLAAEPLEEEIGKTIKAFKLEKSPGVDGMTTEVLRELWMDSKGDVLDFVHQFWLTGKLCWKQQTCVIKLIPKEGDRQKIKNWRPLTMLNAGYKMISKILANRMMMVMDAVVEPQQKGFIRGRKIIDNALNLLICQEWAEKSNQPSLFVKLDFEKAYDRVNHQYLWESMQAAGFDSKFITLARGLVEGSTSKIHVNGKFSEEIAIERGVKQGCPLAPLLFAFSTQPLMMLLREQEQEGNLTGLKLIGEKSALHNFFADDSEMLIKASPGNLLTLQDTIRTQDEEWMVALEALVRHATSKGRWAAKMRQWDLKDVLFTKTPTRIVGARITSGLLKVWYEAKKRLQIKREKMNLRGDSLVELYLAIWEGQGWLQRPVTTQIIRTLRAHKIYTIGRWADWAEHFDAYRPLNIWVDWATHSPRKNVAMESHSAGPPHAGQSTNLGSRRRCHLGPESPDHMLWTCNDTRRRWEDVRYLMEGLPGAPPNANSFIDVYDRAFKGKLAVSYLLLSLMTRAIWIDRNQATYERNRSKFPIVKIIEQGVTNLKAIIKNAEPESKLHRELNEALTVLLTLAARARSRRDLNNGEQEVDVMADQSQNASLSAIRSAMDDSQARHTADEP